MIKAGKIREISDMRDETDLSGLKLTIDLKRGADPDEADAEALSAPPRWMDSFACNFNILIAGMPRVLGVREMLEEWTAWRQRVRHAAASTSSCNKKQEKLHLLQGPATRSCWTSTRPSPSSGETESDAEVVPNLMIGFGIDQIQAEYVAEIKLRNINKEYILKRTQEIGRVRAPRSRIWRRSSRASAGIAPGHHRTS